MARDNGALTVILHVSDIHCRNAALERVLESEDYDIVVASGDFECVETAGILVEKTEGPAIAVTGNLDNPAVSRLLRSHGVLLDGRVSTVKGLRFAGVGGMDVVGSINMLKTLAPASQLDVLVSHHPPRGVLDRTFIGLHAGLKELWDIIKAFKPRLHLFGHIHESPGYEERDGVLYVNPGPLARGRYAVIDYESGRVELKRIT